MFNVFRKNTDIVAPLSGEIVSLENVEDKVFSQKMLGDGIAIIPEEGTLVSPCDGRITTIYPTMHAIGIKSKKGLEILIHIGMDTVELKGEGFKKYVEEGQKVKAGDKLIGFDIELLKEKGKVLTTPVVITNMESVKEINKSNLSKAIKGKDVIMNITVK